MYRQYGRRAEAPPAHGPGRRSATRSPAGAEQAAASKMASWPNRCPPVGCLSLSLPPSTASSVTSAGIRTKLVSEAGVLEQCARLIDAALVDQDAARQDADRTFEHAHVLIEHDVGNVGRIEQGAHGRDQHRIIGAHELAPLRFVLELRVGLVQRTSSSSLSPGVARSRKCALAHLAALP